MKKSAKQYSIGIIGVRGYVGKELLKLIHNHPKFYLKDEMKTTGIAGIFAASLELTKEGITKIYQKKIFDKLMIKKN